MAAASQDSKSVFKMDYSEVKAPAQIKVVVMGNGSSGKTSVINQYCQDSFRKQYNQTIGLDWYSKQLELPGGIHVVLKIWDIGGQSLTGKMIPHHLQNAQGILLVYDVTNQDSFDDLQEWHGLIKKHLLETTATPPHIALVANKLDLAHLRTVRIETHSAFAKEHNMSSHFVCAKSGDQISKCFRMVVAAVTGIEMTKTEMQRDAQVMKAGIVQYQDSDKPMKKIQPKGASKKKATKSGICVVQ